MNVHVLILNSCQTNNSLQMTLQQLHSHSWSNYDPRYLPPARHQRTASPSFFDDTLLQDLVDTTNTYAQKKLATMTISSRSLY